MKIVAALLSALLLLVLPVPAQASHQTDFALFDETGGDTGAACGARLASDVNRKVAFDVHINVTNRADAGGADGTFRVLYADGDQVDYAILAGTTVSLTEAAGHQKDVNDLIRVLVTPTAVEASTLVGSMSIHTHDARKHPSLPSLCTTLPL